MNQDRPTCVPSRPAVLRATAPPQLARGDWLPTSLNRSAHLQPEKTGLPGFPAPLPTWTWQRKEIPRRCSDFRCQDPWKFTHRHTEADRRKSGVSERGPNSTSRARPRPACPSFRLSPPPFPPARHPEEKCFALGSDHTPHTRRLGRSSLQQPPHGQLVTNTARRKWRPHFPPVGTNRRTLPLLMRSPSPTRNPGSRNARAHTPSDAYTDWRV